MSEYVNNDERLSTPEQAAWLKLGLSYAAYADHCSGQLGDPTVARPIPLLDGVLGFFRRDEPRLTGFHIEHFQDFNDWESLRELLGEEVTSQICELHQEVSQRELPVLSGLSEEELSTTMKQSLVRKEFDIGWPDDSEFAARLQGIVDRWEAGN